jgi:hypothetical protein
LNGQEKKDIPFNELVSKYPKYAHNLSKLTLEINVIKLTNYLIYSSPINKTTKAMTNCIINGFNRWGVTHYYFNQFIQFVYYSGAILFIKGTHALIVFFVSCVKFETNGYY